MRTEPMLPSQGMVSLDGIAADVKGEVALARSACARVSRNARLRLRATSAKPMLGVCMRPLGATERGPMIAAASLSPITLAVSFAAFPVVTAAWLVFPE